jgi:phosphoglycerate dehydrogenase-like enzyme
MPRKNVARKIIYIDRKEPAKPNAFKVISKEFADEFELIQASTLSEEMYQTHLSECEFIIATSDPISPDVMNRAPQLKMIHKWGAGYDEIDVQSAHSRGILVARTTGDNTIAVAEHTIMLILALYRHLIDTTNELKAGKWLKGARRLINYELRGKTVGIIGLGNIGKAVAKRLSGFETETYYYSSFSQSPETEKAIGVKGYLPLDRLFKECDIITLHCMLNDKTKNLINADALQSMKKSAIIINTCRGKVVDEKALCQALKNGDIAGAGLDVFDKEPIDPANPLLTMPNVIVTPHVAAHTRDTLSLMAKTIYQNIKRFSGGCAVDDHYVV